MTSIAKRKTVIALAASALFATLSGCAVGPDFKTPAGDKAERYTADALPEKTVATPVAGGEAQTLQPGARLPPQWRSEEHTSELQSLMRISYAVFCLKKKQKKLKY